MIDPHCSPEVEGIIAYGTSTGVPMKVTSTLRPGAITISGNRSFHGLGLAVDFAGPAPTRDSSELAGIFHAFLPIEKHLAELIYAGPQVGFNIKDGARVGKYAQSIHHDHVHVAVQRGVLLDRLVPTFTPDTIVEQAPPPAEAHERTDMAAGIPVPRPQGGYAVLQTRDGGVFTYDGAPFFGSLVGVSQGPAVGFTWTPSGEGYWILQADGAVFSWGDAPYHGGVNAGPLVEHFGNRLPVGLVALPDWTYNIVGQDLSGDTSPFDSYHLPI
jgi:hypothetical protein